MLRYNFRWAAPGMEKEFGFDHHHHTSILSAWAIGLWHRAIDQWTFVRTASGGPRVDADRRCRKQSRQPDFWFRSFVGTLSTFALIWLMNGYFQSFGAPGMVKITAAWFNHRDERGPFARHFWLHDSAGAGCESTD